MNNLKILFGLRLYVQFNNVSVMSRRTTLKCKPGLAAFKEDKSESFY